MASKCSYYTLKRKHEKDYLHKAVITGSSLFFWTTKQNNTVAHAPKENINGIRIYIGDMDLLVVMCPCEDGSGILPLAISNKQVDLPMSSIASNLSDDFS